MKSLKEISIGLVLCCLSFGLAGQDTYNFTQFYFNPALLNPSFTGSDGRLAMFASFRKQWAGIEGAPTIGNFSLQSALPSGLNIGLNASNDKNGLISTSAFTFTGGYAIQMSDIASLRFGISAGAAWNKVDLAALRFTTANDPVQASLLASNFQLLGNVGVSVHAQTFHFGISVPNIFDPAYLSSESFSVSKVNPFQTIIAHASNRFYFAKDKNIFEPYLVYRYNQTAPGQLEAAAVLHLQNIVWIGGSYKQNYGISGLTGFKLKGKTAIGYSYSLKNTGTNQISAPSHEIQIGILLGTKLKKIQAYSFVDTEKEKKRAKSMKELAAERKQRELANKLAMEKKKKQMMAKKAPTKAPDKKEPVVAKTETKEPVKTTTTTPANTTTNTAQTQGISGGPRMKQRKDLLDNTKPPENTPTNTNTATNTTTTTTGTSNNNPTTTTPTSTAAVEHHEDHETEKIARLEEHKEDPDEHHGLENEAHPHAERHEYVKRGNHVDEMEVGDYIIAGVFKGKENARKFSDGLKSLGFSISDFGYSSERSLWYVYLGETQSLEFARTERDKYRKMKMFKDCWLLTVQH